MKESTTSPTSNVFSGLNWRLFGEITLSIESVSSDQIQTWLVETLRPLHLNARVLNKILVSAPLTTGFDSSTGGGKDSGHIHIQVFTPVSSPSNGQTWGFFRIEKKGDPLRDNQTPDHAVAFYLYLEGM